MKDNSVFGFSSSVDGGDDILYIYFWKKNSSQLSIQNNMQTSILGKKCIFSNVRGQNFLKGVDFRQSKS